jgi:hypothetical protein
MIMFLTAAFALENVLFTVLLLVVGLYWVTVILGVLDVDLFHIDLSGGELDIDADADAGAEVHGIEPGALRSVLQFFYIGEVPTMLLVSVMVLSLWAFSMLGNYYLNPEGSRAMTVAILFGNVAASTIVLKFVALPLRKLYTVLLKDFNAPKEVVGSMCRIVTTEVTRDRMGQAEVATKGAPLLLNVLSQGGHAFKKGEEAVVVERDDAKGTYRIAPIELER